MQARLQARHGERLSEGDWRLLEAARSLDHFIDRARATSLRRFAERLNAGMSSHAIERVLRAAWRDYVAEVASWSSQDWRAAILWTAPLPDLPSIDGLLRDEAPLWARQDPVLAPFLEQDRRAPSRKSPLHDLLPGAKRERTLARRWYAHWRSLWPKGAAEIKALTALADTIAAHVAQLAQAGAQDSSTPYRRALANKMTRLFRRHGGTPVAAFCHLALIALDLERLRGGLVRRALFAPAKEAA